LLCPREGLVAAPLVLDQGIGDQMGQGAELQPLLVAAPSSSRPEVLQPAILQGVVQQRPHRVGQGKLLQHRRGKDRVVDHRGTPEGGGRNGDLHNRRTPGKTEGASRWELMVLTSDPWWNAKTLNSLPYEGGQYPGARAPLRLTADSTILTLANPTR